MHSSKGGKKKHEIGWWVFKNKDIPNGGDKKIKKIINKKIKIKNKKGKKKKHHFYLCNLKVKLISPQPSKHIYHFFNHWIMIHIRHYQIMSHRLDPVGEHRSLLIIWFFIRKYIRNQLYQLTPHKSVITTNIT